MTPRDLLCQEHDQIRSHVASLEQALSNPDRVAPLLLTLQQTIQRHFRREGCYYELVDDGKRVSDRALMHTLRNDHAAVLFSLESLTIRLRKNGVNAEWRTRFKSLTDVLLPHLETEEKLFFSAGESMLSEAEQTALVKEMEASE
jgi:hypothetical protein